MGKNYLDNLHSIKKTEDLTMEQMFDITEKLISEQSDEIYGVKTINWRLKSKGGGQLSIHFCADGGTIETVFRTIISVNQLSIYGAVSDVWINTGLVKQERRDPCWQQPSKLIDNDT